MDAQRLGAMHRYPEELPAPALFDPVAVGVRDDDQHRLAGFDPVGAVSVAQIAGAADRVLQHRERCLPAPAAIPIVARVGADLVAGAGRHGVQPLPPARQRDHFHHRSEVDEFLQHRITLQSTNVPYRKAAILRILTKIDSETRNFIAACGRKHAQSR